MQTYMSKIETPVTVGSTAFQFGDRRGNTDMSKVPFKDSNGVTIRRHDGAGLGLAISLDLAMLMGEHNSRLLEKFARTNVSTICP